MLVYVKNKKMKLKQINEATYHGKGGVVIRAVDPEGGDHLGTIGPMSENEANKLVTALEKEIAKKYGGRIPDYDLPVIYTEDLHDLEDFKQEIFRHLDVFVN